MNNYFQRRNTFGKKFVKAFLIYQNLNFQYLIFFPNLFQITSYLF